MEKKNKQYRSIKTYTSTSSPSVEKTFGTNKLPVAEVDASPFIGSVVEKGVSLNPQTIPTPAPQPTVLPFPVARHRSHGPHFGPTRSEKDKDGDIEDDEDDSDPTNFDPISNFASAVERKQKKSLDLSRWRDLMVTDEMNGKGLHVKKSRKPRSIVSTTDVDTDNSYKRVVQETVNDNAGVLINGPLKTQSENASRMNPVANEMIEGQEQGASAILSSSSVNYFGNQQGLKSLESDIDAENRSRLQSMSAEEIAEAQSEIMEKMNPGLLEFLKKRGRQKGKTQNPLSSDESINDQFANGSGGNQSNKGANFFPHAETDSSNSMTKISKDTGSGSNNGVGHNSDLASGWLWDTWRERVEAARGLRFSSKDDVIAVESGTDNGYNVDNVAQRDFLRTEGDPGAAGYTIKEAVQLTRSVIPLQRVFALRLLASVLEKALLNIQQNQVGSTFSRNKKVDKSVDWEAIWAFALGPEPELALALRICLDDNHSNVVSACVKVIQSALSCDLNEMFFEISEVANCGEFMFTAPVFRSKPEIDVGFLRGGFWKYNAKPSNILKSAVNIIDDESEGTIQDDVFFAGQDFAAGLVRMGILPRMLFILEGDPTEALRESVISILIAIARHSPTCAVAIMKYERLVHMVVDGFTNKDYLNIYPSQIKSVRLLKVLAQSNKKNCAELMKNGLFEAVTPHLYQYTSSLDHWMKSGKENCKLSSALMVEQLSFWKICICYGYCISCFSDIFPALCLWLNPPTFGKLKQNCVLGEFASIVSEAYLVLEALARRLPNIYTQKALSNQISGSTDDETDIWSWNYVTPMVDLALKWIMSTNDPYISNFFEQQKGSRNDLGFQSSPDVSLLWVYSSIMHMLSALLEKVIPESILSLNVSGVRLPWLPEFVPKVGLEIIKSRFLSFLPNGDVKYGIDFAGGSALIEDLCLLRQQGKYETSLASVCCLHGLLRVISSIDKLIHLAKSGDDAIPFHGYGFPSEAKILEEGLLKRSAVELKCVHNLFTRLVQSEWHFMQSIEMFGRGGPSPGVGLGWGASGGGFWSKAVLLSQTDAALLIHLLEIFPLVPSSEDILDEEMAFAADRINSVLGVCLIMGTKDRANAEKAMDILLQVPVLKYLDFCTERFLKLNNRIKQHGVGYKTDDYFLFSEMLTSYFKKRWFFVKRKLEAKDGSSAAGKSTSKKGKVFLDTIHEDMDMSDTTSQGCHCVSLAAEWAYQKMPLPTHWFLSPISTISGTKHIGLDTDPNTPNRMQDTGYFTDIAKGGLFFLLGLEAMSTFVSTVTPSPVHNVPLVWKIHSLSVVLLNGMGVLEDDKSRNVYEALQDLYGQLLDEARSTETASHTLEDINLSLDIGKISSVEFLRFQSEIHQSYPTFLETLVEQFASVSYGDQVFGRQVAVYLHRSIEAPVRLAAWNTLVNAHVLEILPPLEKCFAGPDGYLEPIEDKEDILEAYAKSWTSGALDRAVTRGSMAYTLVLHQLSSFIFHFHANDKSALRNKLAKSLLRDYSAKERHERMMLDLLQHNIKQSNPDTLSSNIKRRFEVLVEACERDSSLLTEVEKLKSAFCRETV